MRRLRNFPNFYRVDDERSRTHSCLVSVQRNKKIYHKHFSDVVYGGKRKALQAAKAWRDGIKERHRPLTKREFASIRRRNNRSGVPGVCRYANVDWRNGQKHYRWHWVASWATQPGKSKQVKFAVAKYGEKRAFELACAARRRAVRRLEGNFDPLEARLKKARSR
jgi:hypothetical protein